MHYWELNIKLIKTSIFSLKFRKFVFFFWNNKDRRLTIFYIQQIIPVQNSPLVASDGGNCIIADHSATTTILLPPITIFIENFICKSKIKKFYFQPKRRKTNNFFPKSFCISFLNVLLITWTLPLLSNP